jgi:hypothetical protein
MNREEILDAAKHCVCGDREQDYGTPENSFSNIAALWGAYLGTPITPVDVAAMMIMLKLGRLEGNQGHVDSWTDIAGYAACGGEIATEAEGA